MTSRDFAYWLQGYFEIAGHGGDGKILTSDQVATIKRHLAMVFIHEIDPSAGSSARQAELNQTHAAPQVGGITHDGVVYRC